MDTIAIKLTPSSAISNIGIKHLKRYWEKSRALKTGKLPPGSLQEEWNVDITMLAALGLGLEQTITYVFNSTTGYDEFENWILEVNGQQLDKNKIAIFNASIVGEAITQPAPIEKTLSDEDINFWNEQGYIIIRNVISKEDCEATINLICDYIDIVRNDATTWYNAHPAKQGIMVQLFQHPQLQKNREAKKIKLAYEQLWGRKDIWLNTDRVGFNPPETDKWKFPGPNLHWDISLAQPIPFGLQGILYLADTAANQGAFTLVPRFHNRVAEWLQQLPATANPRTENIQALGAIPIVANAGDFIIWHHVLPHGSSANTSMLPRFVQYINYAPLNMEVRENWI